MFSQRTGISYQALIINPNGEQLPGYNNQNAPLVNTAICLEFIIQDDNNTVEYSEYQSVTTDKYGMVNLTIGTGDFAGGYSGGWNGIVWSEKSKKLKVNLDITAACSRFTEISNQDLTSVPFALFAPGQEGRDGESAYEIWLAEGNVGTVLDFLESLKGEKGEDGLSAFQIWKDLGNEDTEEDFIDSLKGEKGEDGKSAYQIWIDAGNDGTEEDFLNSLKGDSGSDGEAANQSLIRTVIEAAGDNCANGGIKIETGIDSNGNGVLDDDEVNSSQTKYLCNGADGEDGEDGADGADGADGTTSSGAGEIIPSNIKLVSANEDYTIPSGYVAEISGMPSQYQTPGEPTIKINGTEHILGYVLTGGGGTPQSENAYSHISGGVWLNEGDVVNAHSYVIYLSIKLYKKSLFTPKLISSEATVPSGKIWKLNSFLMKNRSDWTSTYNVTVSGKSGGHPSAYFKAMIDNEKVTLGWIHPVNYLTSLSKEIWLSGGTTLAPDDNISGLSILEYNTGGSTSTNPNTDTPPEGLKVGDEWGGGIVVYIDESGKRGRIMAKEEHVSGVLQWSTHLKYTNSQSDGFANNTYRNDRIGRDNSQAVLDFFVSSVGSAPAFEYARDIVIDGYDDWYVPTQWEINQAHTILVNSYSKTLDFLWTSTEQWNDNSHAFARLKTGNSSYGFVAKTKNLTSGQAKVIPFRSFGE